MKVKWVDMKVGVVGVGSMGMNHAHVYSEIADLVGIADHFLMLLISKNSMKMFL
jgi:hypothetical protein